MILIIRFFREKAILTVFDNLFKSQFQLSDIWCTTH